ncbi:hypothetical protein Ancab_039882 [Ancistrocladus abbreviatus]
MGNLSNLKYLNLSQARFFAQIPIEVSKLSKLMSIDLSHNVEPSSGAKLLKLQEPSLRTLVQNFTGLQLLRLTKVCISAQVPENLANLTSLAHLLLEDCGLQGTFPTGIFLLPNLRRLSMSYNEDLVGYLPKFRNNSKLQVLRLTSTGFSGTIPSSISNLVSLTALEISNSSFQGSIPYSLGKLTQLTYLYLPLNNFEGEIPASLANLTQLSEVALSYNQLTGKIPHFMSNFTKLVLLDLSYNNFYGSIPRWFSRLQNLIVLNLQLNNFTGPVKLHTFLNCRQLEMLQLSDVDLILPNTTQENDTYPQLSVLVLSNCSLTQFPDFLQNQKKLQYLALDSNKIQGSVPIPPQSLQGYELTGNRLTGLTQLRVLLLGSNRLYGVVPGKIGLYFSMLRIIDLSNNELTGSLSHELFLNWHAMEGKDEGRPSYLESLQNAVLPGLNSVAVYRYVIEIADKGREANRQILNIFRSLDLSNNKFTGKIPGSIGNLKGLQALNLSHNNFTDGIPSFMGNLSNIESLDLSYNILTGKIPTQLTILTFLENFDVSYNRLTGAIPHGNQFDTFSNDSYKGNIGLCGNPLSRSCGNSEVGPLPQPNSSNEEDDTSSTLVEWVVISMGYLSGLVSGVVLGHSFTIKRHEWFVKTFGRRHGKTRRRVREC